MRFRAALVSAALAVGGLLALAPAAHAAGTSYVYVGQGTDSSSWNDAQNWSPNGVPGTGDSVYIAPPTADHCSADIENAPTVTLANLTVSMDGPCDGNTYLRGGTLTVTGAFTWHGGEIDTPLVLPVGSAGTISPGSRTSSATDYLTTTIDVHGSLALDDDAYSAAADKSLLFGNAGSDSNGTLTNGITIEPGATLTSSGTNDIEALACCVNPTRIDNEGTIDVAAGSLLRFDNAILNQDGTLTTGSASSEVDNFAGYPDEPNTAHDASYTGPGTYRVSVGDAALAASGTLDVGTGFRFVLGGQGTSSTEPDGDESLNGTFTLQGAGEFDWLGGAITGNATIDTGRVSVGTTGTPGSGGNDGTPGEGTYVNPTAANTPSTVTLDSDTAFARGADAATPATTEINSGSTLVLEGSTTLPADVRFYGEGYLVNRGSATVSAGTGSVYVTGSGSVSNTGTLRIASGTFESDNDYRQSGGTTDLAGGNLRIVGSSSVVRLAGGQLTGSGTVFGSVTNTAGSVSPTGTLTVHGSYGQGGAAALDLDLARSTGDRLVVQGSATLRGRLAVRNHYVPTANAKRTVVTATSRPTLKLSCVITTGSGSSGTGARHWVAAASNTAVVLTSVPGQHTTC